MVFQRLGYNAKKLFESTYKASATTRASMASSSSGKDLMKINGNQKTRLEGQETVGHVTRKSVRNYVPPQVPSVQPDVQVRRSWESIILQPYQLPNVKPVSYQSC